MIQSGRFPSLKKESHMRIGDSLAGARVLITQSSEFMGPPLVEAFRAHGATVIADPAPVAPPAAAQEIVQRAGEVDVLVCNFAYPSPYTAATAVTDEEWSGVFAHLVDPLPRLARAVLPGMIARRRGKIIVMGSSTALRGQKRITTYSAARGAQLAWARSLAAEVAPHNVQVNMIAQNFVENPTYYGPEVQALPAFQERLRREVPAQRLGKPHESALLAVLFASSEVDFVVGQSLGVDGGWT
jgi:2-keto-3-deoxy-L-fuconate dehydrogenase